MIPTLFPPGTEKGAKTRALPAVWSDSSGFEKAAQKLVTAANNLTDAASKGDKAAFTRAYQEVGQACVGCHRTYRAKQ